MKHLILGIILLSLTINGFSKNDSLYYETLKSKIELLNNKVDEVKRDQLNYSIEKDLIKDTYSNNYDKVNLFITGILLVFGFLGFVGIRDINSIKKEYREELDKLKSLQLEIEMKSKEFDQTKIKYDGEITEILKQNEEQNRKLKVLEIKEKLERLVKERDHQKALEFCVVALEFAPEDINLLITKSQLYSRILKYDEAIKVLDKVLEIDPERSTAIFNLAEMFLFSKNEEKSDILVKQHPKLFNEKDEGKLLFYFELLKHYNKSETDQLKEKILKSIDRKDLENRRKIMPGWDLYDALIFIANQPESENRILLQNYLWYQNGDSNAEETLEAIGAKIENEENKG